MSAYSVKRVNRLPTMSPEVIEEFMDDFECHKASGGLTFEQVTTFPSNKKYKRDTFTSRSGVNKPPVPAVMDKPISSGPLCETRNLSGGNATESRLAVLEAPPSMKLPGNNLCFLTASVSTAKQWNRYRDEIPMLVEIFGTVEKLTFDAGKPFVKMFHLQDGSSLVGRFYEIDRQLPRVAIGQYVRCVGRLDRDGCLLCVSIREASKQEQQCRNKLMAISARAMYKRMTSLNEN